MPMKYNDKKELATKLREKLHSAKGELYKSLEYKISRLEANQVPGTYSMADVLTPNALKAQIMIHKNLLSGYKKVSASDPEHAIAQKLMMHTSMRLYHLQRENPKQYHGDYGRNGHFEKIDGLLTLKVVRTQLDPCTKIDKICIYTNNLRVGVIDLSNVSETVNIQMEKAAVIEIELINADETILYGYAILPCNFFIQESSNEITIEFGMFNLITLAIEFSLCRTIHNGDTESRCLILCGHTLSHVRCMVLSYCSICSKSCLMFSQVYVCVKCKVRCHVKCSDNLLFNCRAAKTYYQVKMGHLNDDKVFEGPKEIVYKQDELKNKIPGLKNSYDISHTFESSSSKGARYCGHCGQRIQMGDEMLTCKICKHNYHCSCKDYLFSSCGLQPDLRAKMVEFMALREAKLDETSSVELKDFELIKAVGYGAFAKVVAAKNKNDDKKIVLKIIKKQHICTKRGLACVETEKAILRILSCCQTHFITKMHFSFQDRKRYYLGLDFVKCGELHYWLSRGVFSEELARFYTAEIIVALECLHQHNIIYRDLKLGNVLLDAEGHIKLCDFGLSQLGVGIDTICYTYCGSLDTVAPEVLTGEGYWRSADFWSLGVIVYEMVHRKAPFFGSTIKELAKAISKTNVEFDEGLSTACRDFIRALLERVPERRLGHGPNGFFDIKEHAWFKSIDWDIVAERKMTPPFVPDDKCDFYPEKVKNMDAVLSPAISVPDIRDYIEKYEDNQETKFVT